MDLSKSFEVFNPRTVKTSVHLIGCGAVGSQLAVLLARLGIGKIELWDDDIVSTHNLANQNFTTADIYKKKVECVAAQILAINPECKVVQHDCRWTLEDKIEGNVFMCVDSIVPRQLMAQYAFNARGRVALFDFRMGLTTGQFFCPGNNLKQLKNYLNTVNFTDEEADAVTPKSACGFELSVAYSIWALLGYGLSKVVQFWSGETPDFFTSVDMVGGVLTA